MSASRLDVFGCPLSGSALIEASAGTGKTWAICGLVLRLIAESGIAIDRVLVVTFTNAATAELKERIRDRLVQAQRALSDGSGSDDPFIAAFLTRLDACAIARDDAGKRVQAALAAFDEAAIHTIHGFCQRALAEMPFASGQPFALELADNAELCREVAADFWRRHIAHAPLPPAIADWIARGQLRPETLAALLSRHLSRPLASVRWPETLAAPVPDADALPRTFTAAAALWRTAAEAIRNTLHAALPALPANVHSAEKIDTGFVSWGDYFAGGDPAAKIGDYAANYRRGKLKAKKGQNPPEHAFFDAAEALFAAREALDSAGDAARTALIRQLLAEGLPALSAKKRERRQQAFDDLLTQVHAALHGEGGQTLAATLQGRYPAALIDEFQDTDPLQFAIFERIYGGSNAPLFLVGDPKQAIYSFRQADLNTYLRARNKVGHRYTLVANQRSDAGLIAAVNNLFATNPRAFLQTGLDFVAAEVGDKPRATLIADDGNAALTVWQLPAEPPLGKHDAMAQAARATAEEIASLLHASRSGRLTRDGRPLTASDMAVLVRTHAQGQRIKAALAAVGLPAAELSPESIFASPDAVDCERLLLALAEPTRPERLKTALATALFGLDGTALLALRDDETVLAGWIARFSDWHALWREHGIARALAQCFAEAGVAARLLAGADGERRLTNLRHLGELLHAAEAQHPGMAALIAWLAAQREARSGDETAQLRLDSDRQLVSIVTIHKAKGLQYPLVFCPFVFEGGIRRHPERLPGKDYPDSDGNRIIDYGTPEDDAEARLKLEHAAEQIRLLYVALTRAEHRLTLVAGPYLSRDSDGESRKSLLNWLLAGAGLAPEDWLGKKGGEAESIAASWEAFAASASVSLRPLPPMRGLQAPQDEAPPAFAAAPDPRPLRPQWRLDSFTGLLRGATLAEAAASDHDAHAPPLAEAPPAAPHPADDILRFPRGAQAGDCIHAVFERVDFADPASWPGAIAAALRAHPPGGRDSEATLAAMLTRMLADTVATPLVGTRRLADLPARRHRAELEFALPAARLTPEALAALAARHGLALPTLHFRPLDGWLRGFIDLVLESDGRYFVLDWKSNHLGEQASAYGAEALATAMFEHGYTLQALLYQLALHRHLQARLGAAYDPARQLGGALYLFIRGVRPDWPGAGIHHLPANPALLDELSALLTP